MDAMKRMRAGRIAAVLTLAAVVLPALAAGGCAGTTAAERNALMDQNRELQDELNKARLALDAAEADRRAALAEAERARARGTDTPVREFGDDSPFEGIEGVETFEAPGSVTVRVPGDVLFASGKADLKTSAKQTLDQIARVIATQYPGNVIRVEGHTDTDPIKRSGWKDNLQLSLERAATVTRYLAQQGVDASRVKTTGRGEHVPRSTKALSRRVEIVVETN